LILKTILMFIEEPKIRRRGRTSMGKKLAASGPPLDHRWTRGERATAVDAEVEEEPALDVDDLLRRGAALELHAPDGAGVPDPDPRVEHGGRDDVGAAFRDDAQVPLEPDRRSFRPTPELGLGDADRPGRRAVRPRQHLRAR